MCDSMITSCSTSFVLMASHCADWHVDACEEGNGCVGVLWWRKGLWACWPAGQLYSFQRPSLLLCRWKCLCIWASSMQKILWATTFACTLVPNEESRGRVILAVREWLIQEEFWKVSMATWTRHGERVPGSCWSRKEDFNVILLFGYLRKV